jgi:hypothetical protein
VHLREHRTIDWYEAAWLDSSWDSFGEVRRELIRRGHIGPIRWLLRLLVAPGFIWNLVIVWESQVGALGWYWLFIGWCTSLIASAVVASVLGGLWPAAWWWAKVAGGIGGISLAVLFLADGRAASA